MEAKNQPSSIEQWYRRATALNQNWRESKREEESLVGIPGDRGMSYNTSPNGRDNCWKN